LAELFSDRPEEDPGRLDFEFDGLARTLAELAWNKDNETPYTVVVRGDWGRGKTTLLRAARRLLDDDEARPRGTRQVRTLWFNAWKYPDEETVLAGLLGALIDALRSSESLLEQLQIFVDERKGTLAARLIGIAAPWLDLSGDASRYQAAEARRAFYDQFESLFGQLWLLWQDGSAALRDTAHLPVARLLAGRQREHALAIFLDDLDRCPQKRVREVLEAISLFLDLPGVCFYLGLDWERLKAIVAASGAMAGREDEFLEKIFQVAVDLPEVSDSGAIDYVRRRLEGSTLRTVLAREEDLQALVGALESAHPRHLKRVLNDLAITLANFRNTGKLGDGAGQVPERAVLALHLLREALPAPEWNELRRLRQNLEGFMRRWRALDEAGEEDAARVEGASDQLRRLHGAGALGAQLVVLDRLEPAQLDLLVHLGSPPREEARAARATRTAHARGGIEWVDIAGGSFAMGDEDIDDATPVHRVTLSPYRIARHPVTNAQYRRFVEAEGRDPPRHWTEGAIPPGKEDHPVVHVSWDDARAYCAWLGAAVDAGRPGAVSLPTEAQWEYAARGAGTRRYPWGDEEPTAEHANFAGNVGDTTAVGSYPQGATPEGVHDLAGNVWEWCADWYGEYGEGEAQDPTGPETGRGRVLRGGAFDGRAGRLRAANRLSAHPGGVYDIFGFRVVWSSPGGPG
jgi:formylglycine-generating enzyme required for sulfatase activity